MTEITKKTAGALNTAEVIQVVAQLNVNLPYRLKCVHFYEKMLELLTLKQVSPDDDFSRPYFTNEYGSILLGTASFGLLENDFLTSFSRKGSLKPYPVLYLNVDRHHIIFSKILSECPI